MKFGDKVKVISGFYEGIEGIITDEKLKLIDLDTFHPKSVKMYYFEGEKLINSMCIHEVRTWVNEKELEKI